MCASLEGRSLHSAADSAPAAALLVHTSPSRFLEAQLLPTSTRLTRTPSHRCTLESCLSISWDLVIPQPGTQRGRTRVPSCPGSLLASDTCWDPQGDVWRLLRHVLMFDTCQLSTSSAGTMPSMQTSRLIPGGRGLRRSRAASLLCRGTRIEALNLGPLPACSGSSASCDGDLSPGAGVNGPLGGKVCRAPLPRAMAAWGKSADHTPCTPPLPQGAQLGGGDSSSFWS